MSSIRVRKHREKLKNPCNADKLLESKEKSREYNKKYRLKQLESSENAKNFKKKRSQQTLDYIKRKKLQKCQGYKTKRGLEKAGKKFEGKLPKDLVKKKEIVSEMSKKFLKIDSEDSEDSEDSVDKDESDDSISVSEKHRLIIEFYLRDDVSRQMPGMKDFKSFKNASGKKEKIQLRYMMMTCEHALEIYNLENPLHRSGKSVFYQLRPAFVLPASKTPHDVCSCQYHQDMYLLFDSLSGFIADEIDSMKELTVKLVCCTDNFGCMSNNCEECSDFIEPLLSFFNINQLPSVTTLEQWNTSGMPCRIKSSCTLKEVITKFVEKFSQYKTHSYISKVQHEFFAKCKDEIKVF